MPGNPFDWYLAMARILFDARWIRKGMTGVGVTCRRIVSNLPEHTEGGILIHPESLPLLGSTKLRVHLCDVDLTHHPRTEWFEQFVIPAMCRREGYQAFVSFEGRVPFFPGRLKTFSFIYDLSFIAEPKSHRWKYRSLLYWNLWVSAYRAHRILTISQHVADAIQKLIPAANMRVLSNHLADSELDATVEEAVELPTRRFLLAVGMNNPRKDLPTLMRAFHRNSARHPELSLVVTGNPRFIETHLEDGWRQKVINLGYASDGQLHWLYRRAVALVYPSRDEGFGIPPLDAIKLGTPVLCSDIAVLREVLGDAARYFPVGDAESLAEKMDELLLEVSPKPGKLPRNYAWELTAKRLVEAIENSVAVRTK